MSWIVTLTDTNRCGKALDTFWIRKILIKKLDTNELTIYQDDEKKTDTVLLLLE